MIQDKQILKLLGACADPFLGRFKALTEVQRKAIPAILEGKDVLIASATASGKTEAIMAPMVTRLRQLPQPGKHPVTRMLVLAPTRALVNDLHKRLEWPLGALGWRCGRQTSDYSEKRQRPHVLVTTPESLDSMLAHEVTRENMAPVDHLLAHVEAMFLDEAHLYENSVRGDHVAWLVARIRRLRRFAYQKGWTTSPSIQICAGSATVSESSGLSRRLLGEGAEVIRVGGDREMFLYTPQKSGRWTSVESRHGIENILELLRQTVPSDKDVAECVWGSIENAHTDGLRKVLVFVPSRRLSDLLAATISSCFNTRRNIFVSGHHGSLDKEKREEAEKMFSERRDAVLVTTSTLEVGIDIGDVDVIVLCGVPPDTSALLQRIGRGGRRSGSINLVAIPQNEIEVLAFGSMIFYAIRGILEKSPSASRWSVLVQQIVSMIMQAGGKGRKLSDILELVEKVWGVSSLETARSVIQHLVHENWLFMSGNRLGLGEKFSDDIMVNRSYYHCNFETGSNTIPVVDHLTGQTIGHVKPELMNSRQIAIGGHSVDVVHSGDQLLVKSVRKDAATTFRYDAKKPAVSKSYAEHVRRGLGLGEDETIIVETESLGPVWFHFSGEMYEWILCKLLDVFPSSHFKQRGLALLGKTSEDTLRKMSSRIHELQSFVDEMNKMAASSMGVGRFHKYLPDHVKTEVTIALFDVDHFIRWCESRKIRLAIPGSHLYTRMNSILSHMS